MYDFHRDLSMTFSKLYSLGFNPNDTELELPMHQDQDWHCWYAPKERKLNTFGTSFASEAAGRVLV